jgi:hypothetical protein
LQYLSNPVKKRAATTIRELEDEERWSLTPQMITYSLINPRGCESDERVSNPIDIFPVFVYNKYQ